MYALVHAKQICAQYARDLQRTQAGAEGLGEANGEAKAKGQGPRAKGQGPKGGAHSWAWAENRFSLGAHILAASHFARPAGHSGHCLRPWFAAAQPPHLARAAPMGVNLQDGHP